MQIVSRERSKQQPEDKTKSEKSKVHTSTRTWAKRLCLRLVCEALHERSEEQAASAALPVEKDHKAIAVILLTD